MLSAILLLGTAAPVLAQHGGHDMGTPPSAEPNDAQRHEEKPSSDEPMDGMKGTDMGEDPMSDDAMDHATMEDGPDGAPPMNHSAMGHDGMTKPDVPPPDAAGSGPPRAADAIWGAEAMRGSREQLAAEQGGQRYLWFMADRAEYRAREGRDGYLWDVQGYYGGDLSKFWFESEGEGSFGRDIESAELEFLYSRAIGPFFDLQAGIRQDFAPRDRTYLDIGIQGLAPYLFEIEADAFLSDQGDLTARIEGEIDQRITQRLILQPRAEINLAAQDVPELGIEAGIDSIEAGLRLRYEFAREFAPYIGVEQEWKVGQSAEYARAEGHDPSITNYVIGVRFWF